MVTELGKKKILEIRNFHKSFGSKKVHENVSFDVFEGECLGLIGGSGSGKSVLLRSLIGLEKPDSGQIIFESNDITRFDERQFIPVRKRIAYAFQGGALFDSMSVYENLLYPLKAHTKMNTNQMHEKIMNRLREFGLENAAPLHPARISGGMQKRVGLARAMMLDPEIILYDEPTAGLDPLNTKNIQDIILRLKATGVTSILVTHDIPTAVAVCDRFAFLTQGQIHITESHDLHNNKNSSIQQFLRGEAS